MNERNAPLPPASDGVVFLDRDGVLNVETGYIRTPEALQMLPGAAEAVARLNRHGWRTIVYTNQAAVGRGQVTPEELDAIHAHLRTEIEKAGGTLTHIYVCPHHPDDSCACRKPQPGMLYQAASDYGLALSHCYAIGDTPRDIHAGHTAGCRTLLVLSGHTHAYAPAHFPSPQPDAIFPDLAAAATWLCKEEK